MPTPNLSDDELDALFRRATEAYPEEDGQAAWQDMERKLTTQVHHGRVYRQIVRWFAAEIAAVAVLLLVWFNYFPLSGKAPAFTATSPEAAPIASAGSTAGSAPRSASVAASPSQAQPIQQSRLKSRAGFPLAVSAQLPEVPPQSVTLAPAPARARQRRHFPPLLPSSQRPHPTQNAAQADSHEARVASASSGGSAGLLAAAANRPASSNPQTHRTAPEPTASTASSPLPAPALSLPGAVSIKAAASKPTTEQAAPTPVSASDAVTAESAATRSISQPDSSTQTTEPAASLPVLAGTAPAAADSARSPEPKRKATPPAYRFGLLLQYAPEVSTVRFSPISKAGSNVGGQLEYFFTSRLSVNVGVLRAMKRYEARGTDYHGRPTYLPSSVEIDEVDAACRMVDIALNVRYALRVQPQYQLFASAGLSSLLMRDEQYVYYYDYYNRPVQREWRVQKGSNHWLSVVNLSVGYERQVAARWGLRAEPFVKIPLGGVGAGQVRLSSAGVFFGAQYRLLKAAGLPH